MIIEVRARRLAGLVGAYGERIAPAVEAAGHRLVSPLGIWLLLAVAARDATGSAREELEAALGCPSEEAISLTEALLADPPPDLHAAYALWYRPEFLLDAFGAWAAVLPAAVERGPMPSQAAADAWAAEHTLGMIDRFPLSITDDAAIILASALAVRFTWAEPYDIADAGALGDSPWAGAVREVLQGASAALARDERGGLIAFHRRGNADNTLEVESTIAEPAVARADVLKTARAMRLGALPTLDDGELVRLAEHRPSAGQAWTVENTATTNGRTTAVLPAWEIDETGEPLELNDPAFGSDAVGRALAAFMRQPGPTDAKQSALARYGRRGFEAAAVTGFMTRAGLMMPASRPDLTVRFNRPYAAIAFVGSGTWEGLPLFEAWIDRPTEVADLEGVG